MKSKLVFVFVLMVLLSGIISSPAAAVETEQQSQFAPPILIVNTSFLNVRTGPSANYTILLTTVGGTELPVLGVARDRVWYQVSTVAGVGWVNSEFTLPRGDFTNVPFVDAADIEAAAAATDDADIEATSIAIGTDEAMNPVGFTQGREWGITIVETHPARVGPSISQQDVTSAIGDPNVIYFIEEVRSSEGQLWYRLDIPNGDDVWVEGTKTVFRPLACTTDFTIVVLENNTFPFLGPDGTGTLDGNMELVGGNEFYLLDYVDRQYKIELVDGNTGWIPDSSARFRDESIIRKDCRATTSAAVTGTDTASEDATTEDTTVTSTARLQGPRVVINTAFLNLRSGPGAQYTVVTTLGGGAELPIIGVAPDDVWYLVSGSFGQAWLNSEFVLFRGQGNIPTITDFSSAMIARPMVTITNVVDLYAAPNATLGIIGSVSGPVEYDIVARTSDGAWVQISSDIGFGWVMASEVEIEGDLSRIPVIQN